MQKVAHVSLFKRYHEDGFSLGGVEKFAHFLQIAIPEFEIFSYQDFPNPHQHKNVPPWEHAEWLNQWLLSTNQLDKSSIVVTDGFWGMGLQNKVARLISVVHGTYTATAMEHEKNAFGEPHVLDWGIVQEEFWRDSAVEVVSVSNRTTHELKWLSDITADATIEHGIPLDIYCPNPGKQKDLVILHVATSPRKGNEMVEELSDRFHMEKVGYPQTGTLEEEAKLWQRGDILFAPTHFEGNSYAILEALACGLVPVTYATGYAVDLPCEAAMVTDDYHPHRFILALEHVQEYYSQFFPRQWACDHLGFDKFENAWKEYLEIK